MKKYYCVLLLVYLSSSLYGQIDIDSLNDKLDSIRIEYKFLQVENKNLKSYISDKIKELWVEKEAMDSVLIVNNIEIGILYNILDSLQYVMSENIIENDNERQELSDYIFDVKKSSANLSMIIVLIFIILFVFVYLKIFKQEKKWLSEISTYSLKIEEKYSKASKRNKSMVKKLRKSIRDYQNKTNSSIKKLKRKKR